ncbi:MAG TPA: PfkB family carbohydrate kinase [Patescibacteria group bacterium]|nr:PfkB family carbohydrate kinase [Patescibacteria group bacterium]
MIVLIGSPIAQPTTGGLAAGGLAAVVASAAAGLGSAVQLVGRVGEDAAGDAVLLDLAAAGVEHVAVLREPGRPTPSGRPIPGAPASPDGPVLGEAMLEDDDEGVPQDGLSMDAADLELALRYLPDYRVVVIAADLDPAAVATVVAAAGWAGAHLVVLVATGSDGSMFPTDATVLERPRSDPDGAFARLVATFAAALDRGVEPSAAFSAASGSAGWASVPT